MFNLKEIHMKRLLCLYLSLFVFTTVSIAQTTDSHQRIRMSLTPKGLFRDSLSNSYAVIPFEGKTQSELYEMVLKNIYKLYNSPKEVLSLLENETITIYASTTKLAYTRVLGLTFAGQTYYKINIYFKDNMIKIDYPEISKATFRPVDSEIIYQYPLLASTYFDKKGNVKKKRIGIVNAIEEYANWLCNYIIYGSKLIQSESTKDNDW